MAEALYKTQPAGGPQGGPAEGSTSGQPAEGEVVDAEFAETK
jgi:hypothetical protein